MNASSSKGGSDTDFPPFEPDTGQPSAADSYSEWTRADLRLTLASHQAEAEDLRQMELAEAFRRLALMVEVGECLARESSARADEVSRFCDEALDRLANETGGIDHAASASRVLNESSERWGEYLRLIDPDYEAPAVPSDASANADDAPGNIDASALFRMLTGDVGSAPPAPKDRPMVLDAIIRPTPKVRDAPPPVSSEPRSNTSERHDVRRKDNAVSTQVARKFEIPSPPAYLSIDPELRDTFLAEATDLFDRIETLVLSLKRGVLHAEILHELGRCFHTLKGAAGSVGLSAMAAVLHGVEEEFDTEAQEASPDLIEILHRLLHYLEEVFISLRRGGAASAPSIEPEPRRDTEAVPCAPPSTLKVSPPPPPALPDAEVQGGEGPVRVSAERLDELMDLASELISRRGLWSAQAESIKEFANLASACRKRLSATLDTIRDLHLSDTREPKSPGLSSRQNPSELLRRVAEQADDLVVLAEAAQGMAKPIADNNGTLARLTLNLWESLQATRIIPVKGLFQRLARVAHDAARVEGRNVEITTIGEETGVDRALQDKAFEPLLHVVRNAVCHGIEPPAERLSAGKPAIGRITLEAHRSGNTLTLSVKDDGRGLDYEAILTKGRRLGLLTTDETPTTDRLNALIFQPGFSTREAANAIAGRGVGMDVVSQEVGRLHGTVALSSEPRQGTRLSVCVPARLSLQQAMVLRLDGQAFALPVELIELVQPFEPENLDWKGPCPRARVRDEWVPFLSARQALGMPPGDSLSCPRLLLIRADGEPLAIVIDSIDGTSELVFKPMGPLLSGHPLISGRSLSVTGEVILALNPSGLARWLREGSVRSTPARGIEDAPKKASVLVADDSISVRKVVAKQLRAMGHEVDEVSDGLEALGKLRCGTYGLVISDLEMPRMDGFELLAELHRLEIARSTPVLVASTRSDPETRRRVFDLGARDFLPKPIEAEALVTKVRALLYHD
jgi:chemotaxis protein histidine kinase CheA